ncbi:hypothetical protein LWI29_003607 [Acer saccharum]|uniref:Uncharacterized protein n=1 Tax=Acer saccharum TaxID=4024 RepID=A0AA39SX64_ACESA|nr:hypothetical protein LWI29_003607 [Acer saccharum]
MVKQRKQRKHGLRFPLFKRKNINNGSGDNNNNSNEGEKTKEMVLGHPPKRRLMRLNNFGNMVRTGADPMEPVGDSGNIERYPNVFQLFLQRQMMQDVLLPVLQRLSQQQQLQLLQDLLQQQLLQLSQPMQQLLQLLQLSQQQQLQPEEQLLLKKLLQLKRLPQLQPQNWLSHLSFEEQHHLMQLLERQKKLQTKVKAGGDGDSGSGSGSAGDSGGDDGDDNDGGDKTEGGGGGGGKMGTKMEPNGRHDYRNRFSYHGVDENGYPVGQLHRCYYEKPNVCSILPYQRKNINNGSGDNNNNSNEGEKTKEMVQGIHPNRGQIKLKTFGDMVRTGANPMEPVGESGNIKNYHIDQPSQQLQLQQQQPSWQLLQQRKELQTKVKAGGDGDSGSDCGNGSGDDGGDNDSGHKTEGGGSGKMGTKMEPKGQHDNRNRFSCHGGDENGYPVGQLHRCNYQAAIAVAAMAAEMATAIMLVGIKLKAVAMEKWIPKRSPRVNTMITLTDSHIMQGDENGYPVGKLHGCYYEKPNVCSIIPYQVLV